MTQKTIKCAECDVEYTYEPNPNYPDTRKYCANCSEKKQQEWDKRGETPVEEKTVSGSFSYKSPGFKNGNGKEYNLTDGNIRIGAARIASIHMPENNEGFWPLVKKFEEYIRNGN